MKVKLEVADRDLGLCIFCGAPGTPNAHYISRAHGGLGVEQNIVTACAKCHDALDNGKDTQNYRERAKRYLEAIYGPINEDKLKYKKGGVNEYE